jgi:Na+-driven multidrug efflux pump
VRAPRSRTIWREHGNQLPGHTMEQPQARLTQGSVGRHLVDMTVPVLYGIFMMMLQGFVDAWFIGQVGVSELAALVSAFRY